MQVASGLQSVVPFLKCGNEKLKSTLASPGSKINYFMFYYIYDSDLLDEGH